MLIHLPWGNSPAEVLSVWRGLVKAQKDGLVRHIGVSNFNREQIEAVVAGSGVWPVINEIEFHPWVTSATHELVSWCREHNIINIGYGSLGGYSNRAAGNEAVAAVAAAHGNVSSATILLRWALQKGVAIIPGATSDGHIAENLLLLRNPPVLELSADEMRMIENSAAPSTFKTWKGLCIESNATGGAPNGAHSEGCKPSV